MAFQVRTALDRKRKPEGNYITFNNQDWQVLEIKCTDSGNVVVKLFDHVSFDNQLVSLCTLDELQNLLNVKAGYDK